MIFVTGRTFALRHFLSVTMGGRWNNDAKRWEFKSVIPEHRAKLANEPGIIVTDVPELNNYTVPLQQSPLYSYQVVNSEFVGDDKTYLGYFAGTKPVVHFGFSSLSAMVDYIERIPQSIKDSDTINTAWDTGSLATAWTGSKDMREALRLAKRGWAEGFKLAEKIRQYLTGQNAIERRRKYSVSGGSVNVGRLLSNNPQHMIKQPKQPGQKIITFFSELGMNEIVSSNDAIVRAGLIGAISDVLEMNGHQCEIIGVDTTRHQFDRTGAKTACYITVVLKQAGEPLNLNDVVFGLGHPSMQRRLLFAVMASNKLLHPVCRSGHGIAGEAFTEDHPTKPNEFYLRGLANEDFEGNEIERALEIWNIIGKDIELPIQIKTEFDNG